MRCDVIPSACDRRGQGQRDAAPASNEWPFRNTIDRARERETTGEDSKDLDVLVVNYNTAHLIGKMLESLRISSPFLRTQVTVVDNASADDSVAIMRERYPDVDLIVNEENEGFGRANNRALSRVKGRYVLLLNTDAFVSSDTLTKTVAFMDSNPRCGVLGVRLIGREGDLQPSCRYFPTPFNVFLARTGFSRFFPSVPMVDDMTWDHESIRECDWVPGCFYLVRREVIDTVGLFDPRYFLYYEEVDHCRSVKQNGWSVMYFGGTSVVHIGGESAKSDGELTDSGRQIPVLQIESEMLYFRKHHGIRGLILHVVLTTVGDLIMAFKVIVRAKGIAKVRTSMRHLSMTWQILGRTRWATTPTR